MKPSELRTLYKKELREIYTSSEIDAIFFRVAEELTGQSRMLFSIGLDQEWPEEDLKKDLFILWLMQLKEAKPIQYILGETEFYGMRFFVNSHVLIPRPETEELVEWILEETPDEPIQILDVGTGSGCIPVVLKSRLPKAEVSGLDFSKAALEVAQTNAEYHNLEVNFLEFDFLKGDFNTVPRADIIVSNPPYIAECEAAQIDENVKRYEPSEALFVGDEDPLLFYRRIIEFSKTHLNPEGKIYVEINQHLAGETETLFKKHFKNVLLKKDISGNYRMLRASH